MTVARNWRFPCIALIGSIGMQAVLSQAAAQSPTLTPRKQRSTPDLYYVEFRAADMGVYGHSYIAFGRLERGGKPATVEYADFHPQGGAIGLAAGHILAIRAEMAPDQETLALPVTTAFRRSITAAQYNNVLKTISRVSTTSRFWNALAYNCNAFVGDVAESIGMKTPTNLLFATSYIPALRDLNPVPNQSVAVRDVR